MRLALDQIPTSVTDKLAQQISDAIAAHFRADPDYRPKVMDADWDGGSGRVIVWDHHPDWAFLVPHGGTSDYDIAGEIGPMPLPEGVWLEAVNPNAVRVLLR